MQAGGRGPARGPRRAADLYWAAPAPALQVRPSALTPPCLPPAPHPPFIPTSHAIVHLAFASLSSLPSMAFSLGLSRLPSNFKPLFKCHFLQEADPKPGISSFLSTLSPIAHGAPCTSLLPSLPHRAAINYLCT